MCVCVWDLGVAMWTKRFSFSCCTTGIPFHSADYSPFEFSSKTFSFRCFGWTVSLGTYAVNKIPRCEKMAIELFKKYGSEWMSLLKQGVFLYSSNDFPSKETSLTRKTAFVV